jgi:NADPH:quinone reductase-like Zn-dependent oxidoreductase
MLLPVPGSLSWEDAGALMEAGLTSHDALFTLGALRPGWPVLVHAAGSGVSTAAIQIAKAAGATVIGTSRTAEKLERARSLGLDHGILVGKDEPRFGAEVKKLTGGRGVPLVLDFVGAPYVAENLGSIATGGRIVVIGVMGGPKAQVDLGKVLALRATIIGTTLRMRPLEEKIAATQSFARDVLPLIGSGRVKAIVDAAIPMERAREAHERMEKNESFGKLVLVP